MIDRKNVVHSIFSTVLDKVLVKEMGKDPVKEMGKEQDLIASYRLLEIAEAASFDEMKNYGKLSPIRDS